LNHIHFHWIFTSLSHFCTLHLLWDTYLWSIL